MGRLARLALAAILSAALFFIPDSAPSAVASTQTDIPGPAGSGEFGYKVAVLPNGNIVVVDPFYDAPGPIVHVGAVYLYNGATGALISTLTGSTAYDQIGVGGVTGLSNGNYVVASPYWDNGSAADAGAVTWGSGTTGVSGVVSAANSLVGSHTDDRVGDVTVLINGNYVVGSPSWNNDAAVASDAGAATWGNGVTGVHGVVSAANSLVGSHIGDRVGNGGVTALTNNNYVVTSPGWDNDTTLYVGAVTWGDGTTGVSGVVSAANSLVGSTAGDNVGSNGVTALNNGNYVVLSYLWHNGTAARAGAATWGNGMTGVSGVVSAANSLVGSTAGDLVGFTVTALANGNYVVCSSWSNGAATNAGAVTWGNGATGVSGVVSAANSLVGSTADDSIGAGGVTALTNGNYVVSSFLWHNGGMAYAGAVTWGNGATGTSGVVSAANSLVGSTMFDSVGFGGVTALTNGNYVVRSPSWRNVAVSAPGALTWGNGTTGVSGVLSAANSLVGLGMNFSLTALTNGNYVVASGWYYGGVTNVGAVTWMNGTTGVSGVFSGDNSLVGSTTDDEVGNQGVTALANGNYVVKSPYWHNGAIAYAGAVTWGNGTTGVKGMVSAANSLVGSTANDLVGDGGVTALTNGNYVVVSPAWSNGTATNAGAVTWGNGTTGVSGAVSATNSLVGSTANDQVGGGATGGVTALSDGNYVVASPNWDNGLAADAGAITLGVGAACTAGPTAGPITAANSVRGTAMPYGSAMNFGYDAANHQLVVGRPWDNIVSLFRSYCANHNIFIPLIVK
jgi:hypothetical protein